MDYKLCSRLLSKYPDDDIRELVGKYSDDNFQLRVLTKVNDGLNRHIKILEAENRILKEEVNKQ